MYYKYPIEAFNGDIRLHTDVDVAIADAITSSLLTETGERILRPEYGLLDMQFQSISPKVTQTINSAINDGLEGFSVAYTLETSIDDSGVINARVGFNNTAVEVNI